MLLHQLPPIEASLSPCESCILAKHHRESFSKGMSYRVRVPLEIVHSNLCGKMKTPSLGGSTYFLTFIDDFSRKTCVYFLKYKFETLGKFKEFKAFVKKQEGEYKSNDFLDYCRDHGIKRNLLLVTHHRKMVLQRERIGQ